MSRIVNTNSTKSGNSSVNLDSCFSSNDIYDTRIRTFYKGSGTCDDNLDRGGASVYVQLLGSDGNPIGDSKDIPTDHKTLNLNTDGIFTLGDEDDVWGATLTRDIVNNTNFGIQLKINTWWYYRIWNPATEEYDYYYHESLSGEDDFRKIYNYKFNIPPQATILGVKVDFEGHYTFECVYSEVSGWGETVTIYLDHIPITIYYEYEARPYIYTIF